MNSNEIKILTAVDLVKNAPEIIKKLGFDLADCLIISDKKIWSKHRKNFNKKFHDDIGKIVILKDPIADQKNCQIILKNYQKQKLIIAFGSGTINDLSKYCSFQLAIPYLVFPSACSMNGYCSKSASIEINGHKKTINCHAPIAVFSDLKILKNAPIKMIKAGIADALCLYSCWFDWKLSHLIFASKFNEECFFMQKKIIEKLQKNFLKFDLKNEEFQGILIELLITSGQAMILANGSYPASQSEHLIAHCLTMKFPEKLKKILHGKLISITTNDSLLIQKNILLKLKNNDLKFANEKLAWQKKLTNFFGKEIAQECIEQYHQKILSPKTIQKINENIAQNHQSFFIKLQDIFHNNSSILKIFNHFKINKNFQSLSLSKQQYQDSIAYAKFIRNRFTCLDF